MVNSNNKETISGILRSLSKHQVIVVLFAMTLGFIGFMATDLYLPSMPAMAITLHTTKSYIQETIALFLLGSVASQLVYGALADRFGRKITLLIGLSISLVGFAFAVFAFSINTLLVARFVQGLGAGAAMPLFRSLIYDVISGKKLVIVLSYGTMLFSLSPILSPLIGSYIEHYLNWRICFVLLFAIFGIYAFLFARYCPETLTNRASIRLTVLAKYYSELLKHYKFLLASVCSGVGVGQIMAYITNAAFVFQTRFHFSPIAFGWLSVIIGITTIVGKQLNAKCALNLHVSTLILIGNLLSLIAGAWLIYFSHTQNVILVVLPILLMVTSVGFIMGNAMVIALKDFSHIRGTAGAFYGVIQVSIGVMASAVTAHYASHNILILGIIFMSLSVIGVISILIIRNI